MTMEICRRNNFLFDDKISTNKKIIKCKIKILNNIFLYIQIFIRILKYYI